MKKMAKKPAKTPARTSAKTSDTMAIDIGMSEKERREIADGLSRLLADSYTLYL